MGAEASHFPNEGQWVGHPNFVHMGWICLHVYWCHASDPIAQKSSEEMEGNPPWTCIMHSVERRSFLRVFFPFCMVAQQSRFFWGALQNTWHWCFRCQLL